MAQSNIVHASLASATIAGELYQARLVANHLSLVSKNSKAMVLRAGSRAAGLRVLSDFFADLASTAINSSQEINRVAVVVANACVMLWQKDIFCLKLKEALSVHSLNNTVKVLLNEKLMSACKEIEVQNIQLYRHIRTLGDLLDDIDQQIQASNVVDVNFRLEATQTGDYEPQLNGMAGNIDELTKNIKHHVVNSQKELVSLKNRI
jgi:hypothetical protein